MLGPVYLTSDTMLDGYGGTWSRRWSFGLRVGPFHVNFRFILGRNREKS